MSTFESIVKKLKKLMPGIGLAGTPSCSRKFAEWMYCPMIAAVIRAAPAIRNTMKAMRMMTPSFRGEPPDEMLAERSNFTRR